MFKSERMFLCKIITHGVWCVRNCFHFRCFSFFVWKTSKCCCLLQQYPSYNGSGNCVATTLRRTCGIVVVTALSLSFILTYINTNTHTHHIHTCTLLTRSLTYRQLRRTEQYLYKYTRIFAQTGARVREREMCLCTLNTNQCSVCLREPYSVFSLKRYVLGYTTCAWVPIHSLIHSFKVFISRVVCFVSPFVLSYKFICICIRAMCTYVSVAIFPNVI